MTSVVLPGEVRNVPIGEVRVYPQNPRTHSPDQVARIAASMREFGWTVPVLVDEAGWVIAGHGRLRAARELGLAEVPVITLSHLTPAQARAYRITDNRLALDAGWDDDLLTQELNALLAEDFDLGLTGFGEEELNKLISQGESEETPPEDFSEYDENIETTFQCPKCGYQWSGKAE